MTMVPTSWIPLLAVAGFVIGTVAWLIHVNRAMMCVPERAVAMSPRRWTREQIQAAYERVKKQPADFSRHLPPRLDRRYVVVGGSGLVGGDIVLQLLQRGQSPESIRVVDFHAPSRADMLSGPATRVGFVQTDIASEALVEAAFAQPWPSSVASRPLTVFHTAAVIRPSERSPYLYERCARVNVGGTANLLSAARRHGADVFIATSSAVVAVRPARFFIPPWRHEPDDWVQVYGEEDFDAPMRPHSEFFSNYAITKAVAERLVCGLNAEGFRTGCIRPGNNVYGQKKDQFVGNFLQMESFMTWTPHVIQSFVSGRNVALAHLQFEAALAAAGPMPACAGRPFVVTDPGPAFSFQDFYGLAAQLSVTPFHATCPPPLPLLLLAYAVEAWCVALVRAPFLARLGLAEPASPLAYLQPSVFAVATFLFADDGMARRSVEEGGIGYTGVVDSLHGICEQLLAWNQECEAEGRVGVRPGKAAADAVGGVVERKIIQAGLAPGLPVAA